MNLFFIVYKEEEKIIKFDILHLACHQVREVHELKGKYSVPMMPRLKGLMEHDQTFLYVSKEKRNKIK